MHREPVFFIFCMNVMRVSVPSRMQPPVLRRVSPKLIWGLNRNVPCVVPAANTGSICSVRDAIKGIVEFWFEGISNHSSDHSHLIISIAFPDYSLQSYSFSGVRILCSFGQSSQSANSGSNELSNDKTRETSHHIVCYDKWYIYAHGPPQKLVSVLGLV